MQFSKYLLDGRYFSVTPFEGLGMKKENVTNAQSMNWQFLSETTKIKRQLGEGKKQVTKLIHMAFQRTPCVWIREARFRFNVGVPSVHPNPGCGKISM